MNLDVAITNASSSRIFIPGFNIEIAASGSATITGLHEEDLKVNDTLAEMIEDGTVTVVITRSVGTVAELLAVTGFEGQTAYATNGRKTGEGGGAGTGIPCYYSNATWRRYYDDAQITA